MNLELLKQFDCSEVNINSVKDYLNSLGSMPIGTVPFNKDFGIDCETIKDVVEC